MYFLQCENNRPLVRSLNLTDAINSRASMSIELWDADSPVFSGYLPDGLIGKELKMTNGAYTQFAGLIEDMEYLIEANDEAFIRLLAYSYLIVFGIVIIYFLLFTFLYNIFAKLNEIKVRFKDTFAIIIYSQIPLLIGVFILFPLELVIFGDYLFSLNPTPFIIKGNIAYFFLVIECGSNLIEYISHQ